MDPDEALQTVDRHLSAHQPHMTACCAAGGVASSCAAPGYPGPLPRAPLSPDTLDKMKEAAETGAKNNNVENNNVPS